MIKYQGRIIEVVEEQQQIPNTNKTKTFEFARRSPGVRAIIKKDNQILLSKEFRYELNEYDYRLPGGKVFDTLEEYKQHLDDNLTNYASKAVIKECKEEVGLIAKNPKLLHISKAGATVIWDLYYFEVTEFAETSQELEEGEFITHEWKTFEEIKELCLDNKISEDRSLGVLFRYLMKNRLL